MVNITGFSYKTRFAIKYPDVLSATKPIPHDPIICPVPIAPSEFADDEEKQESGDSSSVGSPDVDYQTTEKIHLINFAELNDLVRDLALTKGQTELLGSRLNEFNLLVPGTSTTNF